MIENCPESAIFYPFSMIITLEESIKMYQWPSKHHVSSTIYFAEEEMVLAPNRDSGLSISSIVNHSFSKARDIHSLAYGSEVGQHDDKR